VTRLEWLAESDRLRSLAVRATGDHARALHDRADDCVRQADRAGDVGPLMPCGGWEEDDAGRWRMTWGRRGELTSRTLVRGPR
jgi:hypothetical protein